MQLPPLPIDVQTYEHWLRNADLPGAASLPGARSESSGAPAMAAPALMAARRVIFDMSESFDTNLDLQIRSGFCNQPPSWGQVIQAGLLLCLDRFLVRIAVFAIISGAIAISDARLYVTLGWLRLVNIVHS
jgi:hypothetical protein